MRCLGCPSAAAASIRSLPSVSNGRFDGGGGGGGGDYHYRTQSLWVSMSGGDGGGGHSRIMGHYCCAMIPILSFADR